VKESEGLMEELKLLATQVICDCETRRVSDWAAIKGAVKGEVSGFLYKKTKRSPMILPVIMEV
jgi:ribonuclease J